MKRMNQLYVLSFNLLLSSAAYTADMGAPTPEVPSTQVSATPSWNTEEQALGQDLMSAVRDNNQERIVEILTKNPLLVNCKTYNGWTPLMEAARWGWTKIIKSLIAANADVNAHDKEYGWTALMKAAHNGQTEIVQDLLAAGTQVNAQDNNGWTALMGATSWGSTDIVQALLVARALSTIPNRKGKTALEIAQEMKRTHIVEILQNHVDIEPEEETLMVKPAVD